MLKFYAKKSALNMTHFASLKKTQKNYHREKKYSFKGCLTFPDLYRLIFQTFYHFLAKREIDKTVNFRNYRKLFTNKYSAFLGILAPHF